MFHQIHIYIYIEYMVIMLQDQKIKIHIGDIGTTISYFIFLYFTFLHIYDKKKTRNCMWQEGRDIFWLVQSTYTIGTMYLVGI